jgi:Holliday junction resolvase RusA-like endonuclease
MAKAKKTEEKITPNEWLLAYIDSHEEELDATSVEIVREYLATEQLRSVDVEKILKAIDPDDDEHWKQFDLVYYGTPKAQARPRTGASGFFYDPSSGLKAWLVQQLRDQLPKGFRLIESEVQIFARFYREPTKSMSKAHIVLAELGRVLPSTKPDTDNYMKLVQDALNKVVYKDDATIVTILAEKFYSMRPRVEITLRFRVKDVFGNQL